MQIENGRVLKASIANPRPGMDSYEALALRIARQRRLPNDANRRRDDNDQRQQKVSTGIAAELRSFDLSRHCCYICGMQHS